MVNIYVRKFLKLTLLPQEARSATFILRYFFSGRRFNREFYYILRKWFTGVILWYYLLHHPPPHIFPSEYNNYKFSKAILCYSPVTLVAKVKVFDMCKSPSHHCLLSPTKLLSLPHLILIFSPSTFSFSLLLSFLIFCLLSLLQKTHLFSEVLRVMVLCVTQ